MGVAGWTLGAGGRRREGDDARQLSVSMAGSRVGRTFPSEEEGMPSTLGCVRTDRLSARLDEARRLAGDGASLAQIDQAVVACGGLDEERAAALWLYAHQLTTTPMVSAAASPPLYED